MAAADTAPQLQGPPQRGNGVHSQYVYAIVLVQPRFLRFRRQVALASVKHHKHASSMPKSIVFIIHLGQCLLECLLLF